MRSQVPMALCLPYAHFTILLSRNSFLLDTIVLLRLSCKELLLMCFRVQIYWAGRKGCYSRTAWNSESKRINLIWSHRTCAFAHRMINLLTGLSTFFPYDISIALDTPLDLKLFRRSAIWQYVDLFITVSLWMHRIYCAKVWTLCHRVVT